MTGSVTISLQDYEELKSGNTSSIELKKQVIKAAKEIEVFLSFLCTRDSIMDYVTEFNSYSKSCKIHLIDGKAKIELNNLEDEEI
jgi:hypothetical protein